MTQFTRILLVAFVAFVMTGGVLAYTIQEEPEELPVVLKPVHNVIVAIVPELGVESDEVILALSPADDMRPTEEAFSVEFKEAPKGGVELREEEIEGDIVKIKAILEDDGEPLVIVMAVEGVPAEDVLDAIYMFRPDFTPKRVFASINGFAATIDQEVFEFLYQNDQVKSIFLDEPVGTNE